MDPSMAICSHFIKAARVYKALLLLQCHFVFSACRIINSVKILRIRLLSYHVQSYPILSNNVQSVQSCLMLSYFVQSSSPVVQQSSNPAVQSILCSPTQSYQNKSNLFQFLPNRPGLHSLIQTVFTILFQSFYPTLYPPKGGEISTPSEKF